MNYVGFFFFVMGACQNNLISSRAAADYDKLSSTDGVIQ